MIERAPAANGRERMRVEELSVAYGPKLAVNRVSIEIRSGEVLALIGPSGCGKTTLLRSLNRLVDRTASAPARAGSCSTTPTSTSST